MRVKNAWEYRKSVLLEKDLNSCRVIFGEADFLPGLVIDKYADVLVVESLALGIDRFKEKIVSMLKEIMAEDGFNIKGVYERSDAPVRKKEGMFPHKGFIGEEFDTNVEIIENGVHYMVDVVNGQKTGFFLDQKYNRLSIQRLCKGKRVLDCFTHMGTFALNAGIGGAAEVTGLDISAFAVSQATENAKLNGLSETVKFKEANVLDELPKLAAAGEQYDVVILDPPAFTKSREATKNAMKGYREINIKGLKLVKDGGYLATCSCSHFMTQDLFVKIIGQAATAAHKRLRQVEFRTQAPDHPILWAADESYYLKFLVFQVVDEK
jgi:23S rRNA (cytosine1962-C5)-methyltransferase